MGEASQYYEPNYVTMTTEGSSYLWAMYEGEFDKFNITDTTKLGGYRWVTTVPKSDITVLD